MGNILNGKGRDRTKIGSILSQYEEKKRNVDSNAKAGNFFGQSVYERYRSKICGEGILRK